MKKKMMKWIAGLEIRRDGCLALALALSVLPAPALALDLEADSC